MLTTATPSSTTLAAAASSAWVLRLHGGTEDDQLIPIPIGKSSVGSGPRCSIRLAYPEVRPLHCLITHDDQRLRVRRWADNLLLNGAPFDEAKLSPGDRLMIGSVELEVVGTAPDDDATTPPAAGRSPSAEADVSPGAAQDTLSELIDDSGKPSPLPPNTPSDSASALSEAALAKPSDSSPSHRLTRTRRRKLLAALRFHHQMGIQLERAVGNLEQQVREVSTGQADSSAEGARLASTLATLVDQVREYRREQDILEQRHTDWLERSRAWESRLEEQQQMLHGFERAAERNRALGDSMHHRGRKLVTNLRKGRDSFRALDDRLTGLEQKTQASSAEQDRLSGEVTKALELQAVQEAQSVAWNTVVEATDRLSENYKQLAAEHSRLAGEIEQFAAARGELAAEKAAASEMLAMLRQQYQENQRRQAEFDFQRGQWRDELRAWETRVIERDEWADRFERELNGIRSSFDVPTVPIAEWKSLSEQVASLTSQHSETIRQRAAWESRVANCETRLAEGGEQIGAVQREFHALRAETQEQVGQIADATALAGQVASLANQQAEWENERQAVRGRVDECESRIGERFQQLDDVEQRLEELRAAAQEHSSQAALSTALSEQVALLVNQQDEWNNERQAMCSRVDQCEARLGERLQQLGEFEHQLAELQSTSNEHSSQATGWTELSKQIVSLREQQAEWEQRRSAWQGRIEQCETRFTDLGRQLATVEQSLAALPTTTDEPPIPAAEWTALSEQVDSLRNQQAEWANQRDAWQSRVDICESQFGELRQHIAETEQAVAALQPASGVSPIAPADWAALSEQVASLRNEQAELAQQRTAGDARLSEWETQLAAGAQRFDDLASEVDGLRSAHRDQAMQVTELSSLFEQLAALQRQQVEFDQLRTEWQDRVADWESQLQQRLRQFETFERDLQQLRAIQREQGTLVVQLASQERVGRPTDEPVHQSAVEREPPGLGSIEPADPGEAWESNDVAEQPTISSTTSAMGPSDEVAATESVVEAEPVQTAAPAPVSYLEKYAHIFEEDGVEGTAEPLQSPAPHETLFAYQDETCQPESTAEQQHATHGDEESVEQYMAKLMRRIRGESHGFTASSASPIVETDTSDLPASSAYAIDASEPVAAVEDDPGSTVAFVGEGARPALLNDLEEMKSKTPAPAFAADMRALRALANQSARHAIGVHSARRLRRAALTNCVIAVLALCVGLYLFIYSPAWQSLQFAGACVAMVAAMYWTQRSFVSLVQAVRHGAFQDFDDEDEDIINPPLPIDVDHPDAERDRSD